MAARSRKTRPTQNVAGLRSADAARRQLIEAPLSAARFAALGSAFEVVELLNLLPEAFERSQRRELERLRRSKDDKRRIAALESSMEQAAMLRTMARRANVRLQRAAVIASDQEDAFHGFVSNSDLEPLEGLTVRLTDSKERSGRALTATTDSDGYFRISFGNKRTAPDRVENLDPVQRLAKLFERFGGQPTAGISGAATSSNRGETPSAHLEILKGERIIHRDPVPLARTKGSAYREYVISTGR